MSEACVVLLILCFLTLVLIARRLWRIELVLRGVRLSPEPTSETRRPERSSGVSSGAFEKFMKERPELQLEPKSAQFAAFRKWRKEQGLNWEAR